MPEEEDRSTLLHRAILRHRTPEIIRAFLQSEDIPDEQIPSTIGQAHQALSQLAEPQAARSKPPERQEPAVPIHRSVQPNQIICLECGRPQKTLRRHLAVAHRLTPVEYRAKWDLARDYPMVAPNYREQRSAMAKQIGLGTKRTSSA